MKRLLVVIFLLLFTESLYAFGTGGCTGDCESCHKITPEDRIKLAKIMGPGVTIERISLAPVKGLYRIDVKKGKDPGVIYLDYGKKFLISARIVPISSFRLAPSHSSKINPQLLKKANCLVLGNPSGKKHLWVISDPDCPFCAKLHGELEKIITGDPQVRVSIVLYPLSIHPDARWKSNLILANSKKDMAAALRLLKSNFSGLAIKKADHVEDYAAENLKILSAVGIKMTPAIILPNGEVNEGYKSKEEIKSLLSKAMK